ncbi:MFS transporter [Deinococcus deserti]|uniref:Putative Major facilitator superfamily protein putative membrane protein n=1 Tax=Deinococcus deserti (strain DSM 17065 / CIP 109153 / LMG 22923 / VCD115) TaxID=546414 RepID=C1CYW0_DEIDV|nr:MFS transporter [Deinococcus deserti]ACO47140.2 putative Major facilitator superfamily protein; putative membrane protein [Deinococcus deserti VCD115]
MKSHLQRGASAALSSFVTAALTIELADELVDGATGAAWPYLQADLHLNYTQIGLLLGLPAVFANIVEPALGLLADAGYRRQIVLGGGVAFALALGLTAMAGNFWGLLISLLLFYPASGAFVSLTQATWMDAEPARQEQNMARWTLAGSIGNVVGPLLVGAAVAFGAGWRAVFGVLAVLSLIALLLIWRVPGSAQEMHAPRTSLMETLRHAFQSLRRPPVIDSLLLLETSNFMLDLFRAFLALYLVDAAHTTLAQAALALALLTGVGLLGDTLIIPLLEKISGVAFVKWSAALVTLFFVAFLLLPGLGWKMVCVALIGLFTSGWHAVLQARLYQLLPDRGGTVMALSSITGMLGAAVPPLLGVLADRYGVQNALWLLALGPLTLVWRLPAMTFRR